MYSFHVGYYAGTLFGLVAEKAGIKLREAGHPAKPEYLKMKSIKEIDTYLGVDKADIGKVGYFKPKLPSNLKSLDTKLQSQIKQRFEARFEEWHSYRDQVKSLQDKGLVEHKGNVLVEPSSGKAFTSDYDLFDIRKGTATGESVEFGDLSKSSQRKLKDKPIDVQHGAHLDWREIPAGQAEATRKSSSRRVPARTRSPLSSPTRTDASGTRTSSIEANGERVMSMCQQQSIHEAAHRHAGIDDKAYRWEPAYPTLSAKQAKDNADSYAWFATLV